VSQSELDIDTVKAILGEYRISNADVTLRHDATAEELIDVVEGNRIYIPCIYVLNKIDQISIEVDNHICTYSNFYPAPSRERNHSKTIPRPPPVGAGIVFE